jgi:hypothetical protein
MRMLSMRIQIFDVCWVYAYKFKALAEHTLTKSLIFLLVTAVWSAYAYNFNAFAEHTHTNLRRMLSMRVQIHNVCWVCAYKFITYAEHTHTNLSRMLSIRVQIHNVCWVCAYKVFQQKEIVMRMLTIRMWTLTRMRALADIAINVKKAVKIGYKR